MIKLIQMKSKDNGLSVYEWSYDNKPNAAKHILFTLFMDGNSQRNLSDLFKDSRILSKEEYHTADYVEARQILFDSYEKMQKSIHGITLN